MWMFPFLIISFLAASVAFVGFLVFLIKKNPRWKKWLVTSIASIIIFIVSALGISQQNQLALTGVNIPYPLSPVSSDMIRYNIPQIGSVDLPSTMELQGEANMQSLEAYEKAVGLPVSDKSFFSARQKDGDKYCRVIVESIPGKTGEYAKLTQNFTATDAELATLSQQTMGAMRSQIEQVPGNRMLEWAPPYVDNINGMTAIVFNYRRQLADNPPVLVWEYRFQNFDRLVILTMSYRETEKAYWQPLLDRSLDTFRITNII